jgi:ectoine hydroxylase-related dioxygenase (phytanoyl-CoA dioxygenase family)
MSELAASDHAESLREYCQAGEVRAYGLDNRGPLRRDANGRLAEDILDAYWRHGFYVFEGVVDTNEIAELRREFARLIAGAPTDSGEALDAQGQPAIGSGFARSPFIMVRPLSDPWGGTELLGGRHAIQMTQPEPEADAPAKVVFIISGMCQLSEAALRLYGHPELLSIAAGINGDDFVPYNDATFVKPSGLGGSVSWHQDGVTHWQADDWDEGIHGFNFQVQLYQCTSANCLWVVPGTHKEGRIDIKARVAANGGSEYLSDAVPLLCQPGDVTIANRQVLHGSFANTSEHQRISITFGFHRYASVLGARGALSQTADEVYDEQRIDDRSAVLQVAIDARQQAFPEEKPYTYQAFTGREERFRWNPTTRDAVIRDYYLKDLSI